MMKRGARRATLVALFVLPLALAVPLNPTAQAATGYLTVTGLSAQGTVLGVQTLQFVASGGCIDLNLPPGTVVFNLANLTTQDVVVHGQANCNGTGITLPALVGIGTITAAQHNTVFVPTGL
jgi:hypothetical protein